jgi:hypothetical protein
MPRNPYSSILSRQACLRPEFASLYPGIRPGEWHPAEVMTDLVAAVHQQRIRNEVLPRDWLESGALLSFALLQEEERRRRSGGRPGAVGGGG